MYLYIDVVNVESLSLCLLGRKESNKNIQFFFPDRIRCSSDMWEKNGARYQNYLSCMISPPHMKSTVQVKLVSMKTNEKRRERYLTSLFPLY